jgi:hypothetical protein
MAHVNATQSADPGHWAAAAQHDHDERSRYLPGKGTSKTEEAAVEEAAEAHIEMLQLKEQADAEERRAEREEAKKEHMDEESTVSGRGGMAAATAAAADSAPAPTPAPAPASAPAPAPAANSPAAGTGAGGAVKDAADSPSLQEMKGIDPAMQLQLVATAAIQNLLPFLQVDPADAAWLANNLLNTLRPTNALGNEIALQRALGFAEGEIAGYTGDRIFAVSGPWRDAQNKLQVLSLYKGRWETLEDNSVQYTGEQRWVAQERTHWAGTDFNAAASTQPAVARPDALLDQLLQSDWHAGHDANADTLDLFGSAAPPYALSEPMALNLKWKSPASA